MDSLLNLGVEIVVPAQVIAELHNVLFVKKRLHAADCWRRVSGWVSITVMQPTNLSVMNDALTLAATASFRIYDAIILAAAAEAGCDLLVSDDFPDGFAWRGVVVTNPFGSAPDHRLPIG